MDWFDEKDIGTKRYRCGYCGEKVSSSRGYFKSGLKAKIFICPDCDCPTYFDSKDNQYPSEAYGNIVKNVPENINSLYEESRNCMRVQAFTASVMASRKLLMNIAVDKGAAEGLKYIEYVDYLDENHYMPPDSREWVDHIRDKGNEANHEIKIMEQKDAKELINFIEMLLKFIYEFPGKMKAKQDSQNSNGG